MNYVAEWQKAKAQFQEATGKKKPSSYFLGFIKKKTGISSILADLNRAVKSGKVDAMDKALKAYLKARETYTKTLETAARKEKNAKVKAEIDRLEAVMQQIRDHAGEAVSQARETVKAREASEEIVKMLTSTHLKDFQKSYAVALASMNRVIKFNEARKKAVKKGDNQAADKLKDAMKKEIESRLYDRGVNWMEYAHGEMVRYHCMVERKNTFVWAHLDDTVVGKNHKLINRAENEMVKRIRKANSMLQEARGLLN